jgi:FdhD protein
MSFSPGTTSRPVIKVAGNNKETITIDEPIIEEVPLTIFLNGQELITMLASAGEEAFLAAGFLASEGIINEAGEIKSVETDVSTGIIKVETYTGATRPEKPFLKRYLTAFRGKGRNGFNFDDDVFNMKKAADSVSLTLRDITAYSQMLEDNSRLFQATGAVHGGALAENGQLVFFSFDIGRHNVFDKIYGRCLVEGISTQNKIMVFTGRVTAEILIKLIRMSIPMIIARSAPTSLALEMAESLGITVIGFARGDRLNIYTHPRRIIMD